MKTNECKDSTFPWHSTHPTGLQRIKRKSATWKLSDCNVFSTPGTLSNWAWKGWLGSSWGCPALHYPGLWAPESAHSKGSDLWNVKSLLVEKKSMAFNLKQSFSSMGKKVIFGSTSDFLVGAATLASFALRDGHLGYIITVIDQQQVGFYMSLTCQMRWKENITAAAALKALLIQGSWIKGKAFCVVCTLLMFFSLTNLLSYSAASKKKCDPKLHLSASCSPALRAEKPEQAAGKHFHTSRVHHFNSLRFCTYPAPQKSNF